MLNRLWRGFLIAKNNPTIKIHKDFHDWLKDKSNELNITQVDLTKVLEMNLRTRMGVEVKRVKKKHGREVLSFDFKVFK